MNRLRARLPELTLVLAVGVLFHNLLLGEVIFWGTPSLQFYPWRELAFSELREGRLPLWNALVGNGAPLLANYQTAVFYPPNWLNLLLPTAHLMGWLGMLHLVWAGLGMAAYLRRLGLDRFGQGVGALAFALSGYLVSRFGFLSITSAVPWLPWLLWALDGLWGPDGDAPWRSIVLLGVIVGMQLLAGHAQTTFYSLLFAGLYALWRAAQRRSARQLVPALGGVALGFGLAAIQLLPTLELTRASQRAAGVDAMLGLTYSYWPLRPLSWFAPNIFGSPATGDFWGYGTYWEDATYVGLLAMLLAGRALFNWLRTPRDETPGSAVVPFFATTIPPVLLLALGDNTPVFVWLFRHMPTFDAFQAPARWMLLAVFAFSALAGVGASGWQVSDTGRFWARLAIAGGGSVLAVALAIGRILGQVEPALVRATVRLGPSLVALAALVLLQPEPGARRRWLWEGVALALLAADLVTAHWGLNPTIDPAFYRDRSPLAGELASLPGDTRTLYLPQDEYAAKFETFLDTHDFGPATLAAWGPLRDALLPNLGMLDGVPSANNFDPLRVAPHDALLQSVRDVPLSRALPRLRAMNVGVLLSTGSPGDLEPVASAGPVTAYAVPDPLPRAYFVAEAWQAATLDDALAATSRDDFDPARVVVLETPGDAPLDTGDTSVDAIPLTLHEEGNAITIDVQAPLPGYLVLADTWYPGWRATLDGDEIPILRANAAFRAVLVPEGAHTVSFAYRPRSLLWGAAVSAVSLLIAVTAYTRNSR